MGGINTIGNDIKMTLIEMSRIISPESTCKICTSVSFEFIDTSSLNNQNHTVQVISGGGKTLMKTSPIQESQKVDENEGRKLRKFQIIVAEEKEKTANYPEIIEKGENEFDKKRL